MLTLRPEVTRNPAQVILDGDRLQLQLPNGSEASRSFCNWWRPASHGTDEVEPHPHHLRDTTWSIRVGLLDLRLRHRLHVPRLDAERRPLPLRRTAEQPLEKQYSFQSDPLKRMAGLFSTDDGASGSLRSLTSRTACRCSSTRCRRWSPWRNMQSQQKSSMLRFSF